MMSESQAQNSQQASGQKDAMARSDLGLLGELQDRVARQQDEISRLSAQLRQEEEASARACADCDIWRKRSDALLMLSEAPGDSLFNDDVFERFADTLLEITGFGSMAAAIYDPEHQYLRVVTHRGLPPEVIAEMTARPIEIDRGDFVTLVARTLRPALTLDHALDPRAGFPSFDLVGFRSLVFVPLLADDRFMGLFSLHSTEDVSWDEGSVRWLSAIGRQVGILIHYSQLAKQLRLATAREERMRLGRELHDSLAQALGYLNLQTTLTNNLLSTGQVEQAQANLREMKDLANQTYEDVNEAIFSLRATLLPKNEFLCGLQTYLDEYRMHCGVDVGLESQNSVPLWFSPEVELQLLRIIQEALTNARKHAGASRIWVRVERDGELAQITIGDDGRGFDPEQVVGESRQGFGLHIMHERAQSVGGSLKVKAQPGRGTQVVIRMPVEREGEKDGVVANFVGG